MGDWKREHGKMQLIDAANCKSRGRAAILCIAHTNLFRPSSMVEHSAVNRMVAGSSPAVGANIPHDAVSSPASHKRGASGSTPECGTKLCHTFI